MLKGAVDTGGCIETKRKKQRKKVIKLQCTFWMAGLLCSYLALRRDNLQKGKLGAGSGLMCPINQYQGPGLLLSSENGSSGWMDGRDGSLKEDRNIVIENLLALGRSFLALCDSL